MAQGNAQGEPKVSAYDLKREREQQQGQQPGQQGGRGRNNGRPYRPVRNPQYEPAPKGNEYVVQSGDSLASIAGKFGGDQRKMQALANAIGWKPGDVLQPGQTIKIPEWIRGEWSKSPVVSEGWMNAVQGAEQQMGWKSGPGFAYGLDPSFAGPSAKPGGYVPSYFQDPKTVARWYNLIQSQPSGAQLPEWVDKDSITQAYKWFEFRNGGKSPDQWGYLPANDPGLSFLAGLGTPPPDALMPHEQNLNTQAQYPQPGVDGLGQPAGQTNPYAVDFDWTKLSAEQKSQILNAKDFSMQQVPLAQQGMILSDPQFDLWGKAARGELPWWQPVAFSAMSNPATAPLVQAASMAGPMAASGHVPEAALLAAGTAAMGYGSQVEGPTGDLFRMVGGALMYGSQKVEQIGGAMSQLTGGATEKEVPLQVRLGGPLVSLVYSLYQMGQGYANTQNNPSAADLASGIIQSEKGEFQRTIARPWKEVEGAVIDAISKETGVDSETLNRLADAYMTITGTKGISDGLKAFADTELDPKTLTPEQSNALAMWEASKGYYETLGKGKAGNQEWMGELGKVVPGIPAPEGTVWVLGNGEPVPVHDGYTLDDARARILNGEPSDYVLQDYQREYGISGQSSDFLMSAIYDPLNVLPDVAGKGREMWAEHAANVAEAAGNPGRAKIETLKAQAFRERPEMVMSPMSETSKVFRDLVRTQLTAEEIKLLTPGERMLAGLNEAGAIKELQPTGPGWWNKLTNLTPESKALISAQVAKENLGLLLDHLGADETISTQMINILDAAQRGDMETVRDMGAAFMDNPEFYTVVGAVRDFMPQMRELGANFDLARPNREMFWKVQELLGDDAANVLQNFTDGDPRPDFEVLVKKAEAAKTPEANAFLDSVKAGEVTAASLADMFKVFGDNRVPIHPQEFKALVLDNFYDHMGKWGVDYFKVEKASQVQEALRFMKGAQSLMLLDFSPSYLVNNFLNNRVLMAAGGVLGLTPGSKIDRWMGEFGVTPARMSEGFGPSAVDMGDGAKGAGQVVARDVTGEMPMSAESTIRAAQHGEGLATTAADLVGAVRSKTGIMSKISSKVEGDASKQMYYSAMKSFYGRQWRAGVGFERMPAALEMQLRKAGVDVGVLYNNIEGFISPNDFDKLTAGATTRTVETYMNDAAEQLGMDPADLSEMLNKLGIVDELREKIGAAKTPADVARAIDAVQSKAMDGLDMQMAGELRGRAEQIANKVRAEGPAGVMDVFNDVTMENLQRKFDNDRIWNDAFERSREAGNNRTLVNQYMEKAARENRTAWRRSQAFDAAATKGVIEGLGLDSDFKREYLVALVDQHETLGKFFEMRNEELRRFFNTDFPSPEARQAAWDSLEYEHNRAFAEANSHVLKLQADQDALFVTEFGRVFGDAGTATAKAWRESVQKLSMDMHESITSFRETLRGKSRVEREQMWQQFQPEYQEMWKERARANVDGANKLYKFGDDGPAPTGRGPEGQPPMPTNETMAGGPGVSIRPESTGYSTTGESVLQIMAENGMPSADVDGRPIPDAKFNAVRLVKEYGDYQGIQIQRFDDITPEILRTALENKAAADYQYAASGMADAHMREIMGGEPVDYAARMQNNLEMATDSIQKALGSKKTETKSKRLNDALAQVERLQAQAANVPEYAGAREQLSQMRAMLVGETTRLEQAQKIGMAYVRAEDAMRTMETHADALMTRDAFRAKLESEFKLPADQIDAVVATTDALAEAWARINERTADEWYGEKLKDVVRGVDGRPLTEDGGLYQIAAVNRQMSGAEVENYARALVRSGADELRRAVSYEGERSARVAILDAAHKIDPAMAESVARQTKDMLFQDETAGSGRPAPNAKGSVTFVNDGKAVIRAFEGADVSTVVHEIGHIFRRDLGGNDLTVVEKWAGVKDGVWERAHEEKFARAFEKYLADGKAPTPKLVAAFEKFRDWLGEIYRGITGSAIDIKISDEVRKVFDKALGGERNATFERAQSRPRSEMPKPVSDALYSEARKMLDEVLSGEPGKRTAAASWGSSYPDWYGQIVKQAGGKQAVVTALEKIIKDQGTDIGRTVERLKEVGLERMWAGDTVNGTPPDLYVMQLTGAGEGDLRSALDTFNQITGEHYGGELTLEQALDITKGWHGAESSPAPAASVAAQPGKVEFNITLDQAKVDAALAEIDMKSIQEKARQMRMRRQNAEAVAAPVPEPPKPAMPAGKVEFPEIKIDQAKVDASMAEIDISSIRERVRAMKARQQQSSTLYQDGGDVPLMPVGGYDQTSGYMDVSKIMQDGWSEKVLPALDAMKDAAQAPERRYAFGGFDDATQKQLNLYLQNVRNQMANTKHAALRWGETQRDFAMLNYSKQYGFDKLLNAGVPYQFFMTRSAGNWMTRVLDRPAWMSQYVRMRNLQNTYKSQLPERMRGKIRIPMPFLPEWAGGGMWIDPSPQFLPFKMFLQPLEAYQRDQSNLDNSAGYVLNEWSQDGTYSQQQVNAALRARSGPVWERAREEAKIRQNGEGNTGFDYFSMLFSPALYATLPYYLATGKQLPGSGFPGSPLPATRTGMGLEAAFKGTSLEFIGDAAGMLAKPEQWVREQKGLSEFGEWGDFYLDRQMANMAAEGKYSAKDVQAAMIERKGPIFDEARQRVQQEIMLRTPGMAPIYGAAHGARLDQIIGSMLPSLFPGGLLPEGEMAYKGLKQEYGLAWDAYKAGNPKAISEFFDKHPEYQARLALRRDPAERLQQFLKSEIWDKYTELGPTNRKQANALLGNDFGDFLGSEPGVEFSTEKLATWARMLGGMVPVPAEGTQVGAETGTTPMQLPQTNLGGGKRIDFFAPNVTNVTDRFFKERSEQFPNYYAVQQGYYSLPKSQRSAYLLKFPELKKYWDWKDRWYNTYPEYQPVFKGEVFRRVDTATWNPALVEQVQLYAMTGQKLGPGTLSMLEFYWAKDGKPYGDFRSWLDSQVVPSMMYGESQ